MKKLILLIAISMFGFQTFAQSLLDEGMQWNVGSGHSNFSTEIFKIEGDTIIDSLTYKKLIATYDTAWSYSYFRGAIRMDETKKVYFNYYGTDLLIYDFNLNVNDTFINEYCSLVVQSIDYVLIDNEQIKKKITLKDISWRNVEEFWIEDIGSNFGILNFEFWVLIDAYFSFDLLCCKKNDEFLYHSDVYDFCFFDNTSVEKIKFEQFKLSPNPMSQTTKIELEKEFKEIIIEVYNIQGQLIDERKYNNLKTINFERKNLHSGIYFLKLKTENWCKTEKLVIE